MFSAFYLDDVALPPVRRCRGLGSPGPRADVTPRATRHGAVDRSLYYDGRVIDLDGMIVGATELEAWEAFDALKGRLQLGSTHVLRFRRTGIATDEQAEVVVASPVDDGVTYEAPNVVRWTVSLHAPDPRMYGSVLRSGSVDPAASIEGGGVTFPLVLPITFSTSTATHLELTNAGNSGTPPTLTLRGPVGNPVFDNDTIGKSIYITYKLGESDTVEVDVNARLVRLNGAERMDLLNAADTEWWEMVAGTNRLRVRGTGMAVGKTLLKAQYRDARI